MVTGAIISIIVFLLVGDYATPIEGRLEKKSRELYDIDNPNNSRGENGSFFPVKIYTCRIRHKNEISR